MQLINVGDTVRVFSTEEINKVFKSGYKNALLERRWKSSDFLLDIQNQVFKIEGISSSHDNLYLIDTWHLGYAHFTSFLPEEILELIEVAE